MNAATLARFFGKVAHDGDSECWTWQGAASNGYGQIHFEGRTMYAHRVSYEHHVGAIPVGLQVDHLCRNRRCVNHDHLELVTCQENIRRGYQARGGSKLTQYKDLILSQRASGATYAHIARLLGVSDSTVFECVRGWSG